MPTLKRNHAGIFLNIDAEKILVDCGEGIQRQFKTAKINPCKLTKLLITHWHGDHVLGIPGLLQTLYMSEYAKTLNIYGPGGTKSKFELLEELYGKFKIKHNIKEIAKGRFVETKDFIIEAMPMNHGIPTVAYSLTFKDKLKINKKKLKKLKLPNSSLIGELQKGKDIKHPETKKTIKTKSITYLEKGKKITIIMDTEKNANAIKLANNSDILICESSYLSSESKKAKEHKHLTATQAAEIAKKAKVKKLVLTHLSHRYENNPKEILKEAEKTFKNTKLAKDFDRFVI